MAKDESNIDAQMRYLVEKCEFQFSLDDTEKKLLDTCRRVQEMISLMAIGLAFERTSEPFHLTVRLD